MLKKADLLIALKRYKEALFILDHAETLDSKDANLYILKTDAYLALDLQQKAATVLEAAIEDFHGEEKLTFSLNWQMCMMIMKTSIRSSIASR